MRKLAFAVVLGISLPVVLPGVASALVPPANDDLADAAKVWSLPAASTALLPEATAEPGEDASCGGAKSVWYSYRSPVARTLSATTVDAFVGLVTAYPTPPVHVYQKVHGQLVSIGCGAPFTFEAEEKGQYFFRIGDDSGGELTFLLAQGTSPSPYADSFHEPLNLVLPPFPFEQSQRFCCADGQWRATLEPDEPAACGTPLGSFWYRFRAEDVPRTIDFNLFIGEFFAWGYISILTEDPIAGVIGQSDCRVGTSGDNVIRLTTVPGRTYLISVGPALPECSEPCGWDFPAHSGALLIRDVADPNGAA